MFVQLLKILRKQSKDNQNLTMYLPSFEMCKGHSTLSDITYSSD